MSNIRWLFALAVMGLCLPATAQVRMAVSLFQPQNHPIHVGVKKWCDEVAQATEKRVTCTILPKPAAPPPAQFDAVRDGLADLTVGIHGYTPGRFKLTEIAEFPFLGDSAEVTSVAYQRIFERRLAAIGEHKGVRVITMLVHSPGQVFSAKAPIASLTDFSAQKFRVGGGLQNELGRLLGVSVVLKPANESYELVSTGVVDGVFFPLESIFAHRIDSFIKYRTKFPGGMYNTSFFFVMNEDTWKRIGAADQQAIDRLSGEHAARIIGREWDLGDARAEDRARERGIQTTLASPEFVDRVKAQIAPMEKQWESDVAAKGLQNAADILREFRAEIDALSK